MELYPFLAKTSHRFIWFPIILCTAYPCLFMDIQENKSGLQLQKEGVWSPFPYYQASGEKPVAWIQKGRCHSESPTGSPMMFTRRTGGNPS